MVRYFFEISDYHVNEWPRKYLIGYVEFHKSGLFYGHPLFKKAMFQSDKVIRCDDWGNPRYIKLKQKDPDFEKVDQDDFMYMQLACEDLP